MNGQPVSIDFSVGLSGANPTVTSANIPGHTAAVIRVVKETSSNLVECFEGTYSTNEPETGVFNVILSRSLGMWTAAYSGSATPGVEEIDGTIARDGKMSDRNGKVLAQLSGNRITGSYKNDEGYTVTVSGKRTL